MTDTTRLALLREYGEAMYLAGKLHAHLEVHVCGEPGPAIPVAADAPGALACEPERTPQPIEAPGSRKARGPLKGRILAELGEGPINRRVLIASVVAQRPGTSTDAVRSSLYALHRDGQIAMDGLTVRLMTAEVRE